MSESLIPNSDHILRSKVSLRLTGYWELFLTPRIFCSATTSQSRGCGPSHVIMFGLFSSHDKEVPVEERNGEGQPEEEEEQTAGREEEGEGGEEEEAPADEDEEVEETDEVTTARRN